jgi:dihydromethanopterin reductase (acceptor)
MTRIAWGITGAGHFLSESADWLARSPDVDVFLSRAAEEVIRMYGLEEKICNSGARLYRESRSLVSVPQVARFSLGVYRVLLVAPASGNSVAKFVYGISDTPLARPEGWVD